MMEWIVDNLFGEIISFIFGGTLAWVIANRKHIITSIEALIYKKTDFRVSIAYLFRIKIDNRYLLIKGNRIEQYQPVGGVYKYHSSFNELFNSLELRHENEEAFYEKNDLRVYVKGRYLDKLINWFESGKNRECTIEREFVEELIETDIVDKNIMEEVDFEFLKRVNNGIHYSPHFKCKEILIYDIYDVILNENAKATFELCAKRNTNIVLATFDEIERECLDIDGKSCKIGAHAKHIR
ncbi:MAG: hypothetical protein PHX08_12585 [Lachnospiraceae bacterium]|nr:hypothetical protein [Lachnospiraceae bacterium]